MFFLDNVITGGNNKEDHCSGKQNRVRDDHSTCHNFSPFTLTTAESPPVTSDSSSCLLLQFSHYIRFESLNFPGLKHWSSWWFGRHAHMLNTEQLLPDGSIILSLNLRTSAIIPWAHPYDEMYLQFKGLYHLKAVSFFSHKSYFCNSVIHFSIYQWIFFFHFNLCPNKKIYWIL